MDAALVSALVELLRVGGLPAAVVMLVAVTWLQDRKRGTDHGHHDRDEWRDAVHKRLATIEAKLEILWRQKD